jgi:hypothetical protein
MDFKSLLASDMKIFHNPLEMAEKQNIYYNGDWYTVPIVLDHTQAHDRASKGDHAEGIYQADCIAYIAHIDLGFIPSKGASIEIGTDATGYIDYTITRSDYEDGEIVLEMVRYDE